jgi:2-oxo-4-hydroxy-4-carboxy-5-ureidoimidazoline decarboxylase
MMNLARLNTSNETEAAAVFSRCCSSRTWVLRMVAARPYADHAALITAAQVNWLDLSESDYLEAFDGHPKIGELDSLISKCANTNINKQLAAGEQSGVNDADQQLLTQLAQGNVDYYQKFGFIFILCATGKSGSEMLTILQSRLGNDRTTELKNAVQEQETILTIRLNNVC